MSSIGKFFNKSTDSMFDILGCTYEQYISDDNIWVKMIQTSEKMYDINQQNIEKLFFEFDVFEEVVEESSDI